MPTSALTTDLLPMGATRTPSFTRKAGPQSETGDFGRTLENSRLSTQARDSEGQTRPQHREQTAADRPDHTERQVQAARSASDRRENPPGLRKPERPARPEPSDRPSPDKIPDERAAIEDSAKTGTTTAAKEAAKRASKTSDLTPADYRDVCDKTASDGAELPSNGVKAVQDALKPELIVEAKSASEATTTIAAGLEATMAQESLPTPELNTLGASAEASAASPELTPAGLNPAGPNPASLAPAGFAPAVVVGAAVNAASPAVAMAASAVLSADQPQSSVSATTDSAASKSADKDDMTPASESETKPAKNTAKTNAPSELTTANLASKETSATAAKANEPQTLPQAAGQIAPQVADTAPPAKAADPAQAMARGDAPVPLQAVAVEIGMRAMRGSKEFSIRLDPEDLGRIDIKLEISEAGQVQAKLMVERVETLQLLQRDAKTLERAFDQAGLKTSPDGLQFSLRDPGQQGRQNAQQDQTLKGQPFGPKDTNTGTIDEISPRTIHYRTTASGGLDIRI